MSTESQTATGAAPRAAGFVVLGAGKGTRMKSDLPKVLHPVAGLPMLGHVIRVAETRQPERLAVVVGHQSETVSAAVAKLRPGAATPLQEPQLGTAHAVQQAREALDGFHGDVFILYGDTPLIRAETLEAMAAARAEGAAVVVLGFEAADPTGYGRLITGIDGSLERIVEHKDATTDELAVKLCNSGVMCVDGARLFGWLDRIDNNNAKGEYYLTDIVGIARTDGARCAIVAGDEEEVLGVNSRIELAEAEAAFQRRARENAMREGATLTAPDTVFFAHDTKIGRDVEIGPNVAFGPGVEIDDKVEIRAYCHLEGCRVASGAQIGPFARLRPGAVISAKARIGNFVEVKNAIFGEGAKANHLAYIGDASIGAGANIGAGTITCNYDGYLKHRTAIGEGAFIGSNSSLVAPVEIGANAIVAAGSTITERVEGDALGLGRARQTVRPGLGARIRESLAEAKAARKAAEKAETEAAQAEPSSKSDG
ncbi:MAG: bifunctional UDP-N-acetylglucosamine diphosphorylase/glucosamine-1-phosphate N-acetyltransferase GlmU [Neomegalonema sp.]|nr:bifunctional UDP-N-acetylglucosamine diphosphorylase/glucosamine-1-phosphate N-acetyltransferase GlmU [Neomegalonema sp.]